MESIGQMRAPFWGNSARFFTLADRSRALLEAFLALVERAVPFSTIVLRASQAYGDSRIFNSLVVRARSFVVRSRTGA
jgi:hypothetical protein